MGDDTRGASEDLQRQINALSDEVVRNRADIDTLEARADAANDRADELEARADDDRDMITELHVEGVLSQQHVEQLEQALRSSRTIGMAVGMVMANRHVNEEAAFDILRSVSQNSNRKLRDIADELVRGADRSDSP